jgi:hypothetical protein
MSATSTTEPAAIHEADGLMHLIITFLAPMFLGVSGGDIKFARTAAMQTVRSYQARNQADLIAIAQIVAYGLAALGSLSLSMGDDISVSMALRLRGNANALNRSAEHNRRALREGRHDAGLPRMDGAKVTAAADQIDHVSEADALAGLAETQRLAAEQQSRPQNTPLAAATTNTPFGPAMTTERDIQAMWANAMTDVAAEFTADLQTLPPQERKLATMRIRALSTTAHTLLSSTVPPRLQPGDLAAIMQPYPPNRAPKNR